MNARAKRKSSLFLIILLAMSLISPVIFIAKADSDTFYVANGFDDAFENGDSAFHLGLGYLINRRYSPNTDSNYRCIGVRYSNINIPQGSTVTSASFWGYIQGPNDDVYTTIYGNDVDDAQNFNDNQNIISIVQRPRTTANVVWQAEGIGADNTWVEKTGLEGIINEIVNRATWSSGNSIVLLFIADVGSIKSFAIDSYEGDSSKASRLDITWTPSILPPSDPNLLFGAGFNASSPYVDLHWNHSLGDVQFFEVQNSSDGISWDYLGQTTTTNYTDSTVANGTERYYRVRACNQTDLVWYNSSFTDLNFETVYFISEIGNGAIIEDNYFWVFIAIVLSIIVGLLVWMKDGNQ